jgi:colanic acid biosynthesis protein WcaH
MDRPPIPDEEFAVVVRAAPLISIDLVLRNILGQVFVGRRANEPAKGTFFVPGGAVRKNETLDAAFRRIVHAETGIAACRSKASFLGVYEHFYAANRFGDPGFGTHYVVLAYELLVAEATEIRLDSQHVEYLWLSLDDLRIHPEVHENTKAYAASVLGP